MGTDVAVTMDNAAAYGVTCARHVQNIWQSDEELTATFSAWVKEWASENVPMPELAMRKAVRRVIAARVLLGVWIGSLILGVALLQAARGWSQFLVTLAVVVFVAWLMVRGSRRQAKEKLQDQYQRDGELILGCFFLAARSEIENLRQATRDHMPSGSGAFAVPPPPAQPYGVSHQGAEAFVAAWMRHLGEADAAETQFTNDGGIDVTSRNYIAQVKNYANSVPVQDVREFAGVASLDPRKALFFTSGSYPTGATQFADQAGIALFIYDANVGTMNGANTLGAGYMQSGL